MNIFRALVVAWFVIAWVVSSFLGAIAFGQEAEPTAELCLLEVSLTYGDHTGNGHVFPAGEATIDVDDHLRMRFRRIRRKAGESFESREDGNFIGFDFEKKGSRYKLQWKSGFRGRGYSSSSSSGLDPKHKLQIVNPRRWHSRVEGGRTRMTYALLRVENDPDNDWGPSIGADTPEAFLEFVLRRFRDQGDVKSARAFVNMARFVNLSAVIEDGLELERVFEDAVNVLQNEPNSFEPHPGMRITMPGSGEWMNEQAALANGVPGWIPRDLATTRSHPEGGNGPTQYPFYRYLAENRDFTAETRVTALGRVLSSRRRIGYHTKWIEEIESGNLVVEEPYRTQLLDLLHSEVDGREKPELFTLAGATILVMILSLIAFRFFTRRMMFPS